MISVQQGISGVPFNRTILMFRSLTSTHENNQGQYGPPVPDLTGIETDLSTRR